MARERESERDVGRADDNLASAADAASQPQRSDRVESDDRGGSRDGERLDAGDPGDRDQLDSAGGRRQSRR